MLEHYKGHEALAFRHVINWRQWLEKNHTQTEGVWLIIYKKETGIASVNYHEALDEALCYGWVDSRINKRDERSYYQYFAPRRKGSNWSRVNKEKVAGLIAAGRMTAAGMRVVDAAKKDGTWDALNDVENLLLPDDLAHAFATNPKALSFWDAFPRSVKRGILEWLLTAKQAPTRLQRIQKIVAMAAQNKRANFEKP